jgi:hypothetical protein
MTLIIVVTGDSDDEQAAAGEGNRPIDLEGESDVEAYREKLFQQGFCMSVWNFKRPGLTVRNLEDQREYHLWQYVNDKGPWGGRNWVPWLKNDPHPNPFHDWRGSIGLFREREQMLWEDRRNSNPDKSACDFGPTAYYGCRTTSKFLSLQQERERDWLAHKEYLAMKPELDRKRKAREEAQKEKIRLETEARELKRERQAEWELLRKAETETKRLRSLERITALLEQLKEQGQQKQKPSGRKNMCTKTKSIRRFRLSQVSNALLNHHKSEHERLFGVRPSTQQSRQFIGQHDLPYT